MKFPWGGSGTLSHHQQYWTGQESLGTPFLKVSSEEKLGHCLCGNENPKDPAVNLCNATGPGIWSSCHQGSQSPRPTSAGCWSSTWTILVRRQSREALKSKIKGWGFKVRWAPKKTLSLHFRGNNHMQGGVSRVPSHGVSSPLHPGKRWGLPLHSLSTALCERGAWVLRQGSGFFHFSMCIFTWGCWHCCF